MVARRISDDWAYTSRENERNWLGDEYCKTINRCTWVRNSSIQQTGTWNGDCTKVSTVKYAWCSQNFVGIKFVVNYSSQTYRLSITTTEKVNPIIKGYLNLKIIGFLTNIKLNYSFTIINTTLQERSLMLLDRFHQTGLMAVDLYRYLIPR